jgi:hypothetical protein
MAYKEIVLTEEEQKAGSGSYVKFEAIGAKFAGVFVSANVREVMFPGQTKPRNVTDYVFKNREGTHTLSAPFDLDRKLKKAALKPGYRVAMVFTGEVAPEDPSKSAMKLFKVLVDDEITTSTAAVVKPLPPPAPKPPPPSAGSEFDDIPL